MKLQLKNHSITAIKTEKSAQSLQVSHCRFSVICGASVLHRWQLICLSALLRVPGCLVVCSAMISPTPSELTHRVNLNRSETGSGATSPVWAHAGRYCVDLTLLLLGIVPSRCSLKASCIPSSFFGWQGFSGEALLKYVIMENASCIHYATCGHRE